MDKKISHAVILHNGFHILTFPFATFFSANRFEKSLRFLQINYTSLEWYIYCFNNNQVFFLWLLHNCSLRIQSLPIVTLPFETPYRCSEDRDKIKLFYDRTNYISCCTATRQLWTTISKWRTCFTWSKSCFTTNDFYMCHQYLTIYCTRRAK